MFINMHILKKEQTLVLGKLKLLSKYKSGDLRIKQKKSMHDGRMSKQAGFNHWMTIRLAMHYLLKWHLDVSENILTLQLSEREQAMIQRLQGNEKVCLFLICYLAL